MRKHKSSSRREINETCEFPDNNGRPKEMMVGDVFFKGPFGFLSGQDSSQTSVNGNLEARHTNAVTDKRRLLKRLETLMARRQNHERLKCVKAEGKV